MRAQLGLVGSKQGQREQMTQRSVGLGYQGLL